MCCGKWSSGSESEAVGALGVQLVPFESVAVDPELVPLGTTLEDAYGNTYVAADTGSVIDGYRIDIFTGNHQEALNRGITEVELWW